MVRLAIILILASAYFSPARALTVDSWQTMERNVLDLVNADRAALGLGTLAGDSRLHDAAIAHSTDMAVNDFFSHTDPDGANAGLRAQAAGYDWTGWGENIAAGYTSAESVSGAWLDSPGHRDNMRNASFTDIGIGLVPGTDDSEFATYWTMVLAAGDSATGDPTTALAEIPALNSLGSLNLMDPTQAQVAAVPLPPSIWLFAFALAAVLLVQRRCGPSA